MINKIGVAAFSCILTILLLGILFAINRKQTKVYTNNIILFCISAQAYLVLVFVFDFSILIGLGTAYIIFYMACIAFKSKNEDIDNIVRLPVMMILLYNLINLKYDNQTREPIAQITQDIGETIIEDSRQVGQYQSCVKICQNGFAISSSNALDTVFPDVEVFIIDLNKNELAEEIAISDDVRQNISVNKGIKLGVKLNLNNLSEQEKTVNLVFRIKKVPNKISYDFLGQKLVTNTSIDLYGGLVNDRVVRRLPLQNATWFGLSDPRLCYYMKTDEPFKDIKDIDNCIYVTSGPIVIGSGSSNTFNATFLTSPRRFDVLSEYGEFRLAENLFNYSFIPLMSKTYKFLLIGLEIISNYINPILSLVLILLGIMIPLSIIYSIFFRQTGKNLRRILEIMSEKGNPEAAMPSIVQYIYNARLSRNKVISYVCFLAMYYLLSLFPVVQMRTSGVFFQVPFLWISDLTLPIDPYNLKNLIQFCTKIDLDSITVLRYIFKINPSLTSLILFFVQYISLVHLSSKNNPDNKNTTTRILFVSCVLLGSLFTPILGIVACIYQIVSKVEEYLPKLFDKNQAIINKTK